MAPSVSAKMSSPAPARPAVRAAVSSPQPPGSRGVVDRFWWMALGCMALVLGGAGAVAGVELAPETPLDGGVVAEVAQIAPGEATTPSGEATTVGGVQAPEKLPSEEVTVEAVQSRLTQIEGSQALDDAAKAKVRELSQQTLQDLEAAAKWAAAVKSFEKMATKAPDDLAAIKAELDALPRQAMPSIPEASLLQLEQAASQKESDLKTMRAALAELEAEPKRRASRRLEIPKLAASVRERLAEVDAQLRATPAATEAPEMALARRQSLLARRRALEQELLSYEKEPKAYEVRAELLPLRRDLAARQIALMEQELTQWQRVINQQRQRDVEAQLRDAKREARQANPAIAKLTQQNADLAERRKSLAQTIVQTTKQLDETNQKLTALRDQFERIQGKVDTVGLTNAIGLLLRKHREAMPDLRTHRGDIKSRQLAIRESQLEMLQLEDRRSDLANIEAQIDEELRIAGQVESPDNHHELEVAARGALETERDYLDALIVDLNSYFDKLVDLDNAEWQLIDQTEKYAKYIDERVLWISSAPVLGPSAFQHVVRGTAWLMDPDAWLDLAGTLLSDVRGNPLLTFLAVAVFGPLLWCQRRLRRGTVRIGERAKRANCCSVVPTVEAVLLTGLITTAVPGILWYVAWRLNVADSSEFSKAVAAGLVHVAGVYLVLDFLQQMCRLEGLSEAHFDWPVSALKPARQYIRAAKLLVLPLMFATVTVGWQENERWADSLGRASFIGAMLVAALLVQRSLRPAGGICQAFQAVHRGSWRERIRPLWYPLAVLLPLALAALAAAGYYYTAQQLTQRLVASAYVLLGLTLVRSLLLRWVLIKRRRLAMEQSRQRRAASLAEARSPGEGDAPSHPPAAVPHVDLAVINAQTRRLIEYSLGVTAFLGLWLVWVDVLPALGILDRIALWQGADPSDVISLADLGLAVLIGATTMIAAKNIPGLLEMTVLQRLPLDAGFRYTIGAVSRYIIVVIGLLIASHTVGLGWGKVQWLVAAISVGLGFGLQEIFANFVSGLVILFERPVRVGDVVTVDEVTGVVSRIRMRATTITNWDRKEFIVPNKEFITGRVLNWTLTDQVNRVVVTVGIAYGSDTSLAAELLMKAASEHPLVLDDPAPRVAFEKFGDSALEFVLRCYLPDLENRLQVIHDLHTTVDRDFRRAGIEIAFPQQDVHIRTVHAAEGLFDRNLADRPDGPRVARDDAEDEQNDRKVA